MKMKGFTKRTCFLMLFLWFVTLTIARAVPVNNPQTCIQTDQSSKDLISEMLLLLKKLNTDVTNSISQINGHWRLLGQQYEPANYPIFISLSHGASDNMQTRLKVDHCILKSFLPLLNCTIKEFGAVPNTKGIVHKLKDLKWDSKNLIRHFQEARDTFHLPQPANQATDSTCEPPSCTVRSHSALRNSSIAVIRGKVILEEILGKLRLVYESLKTTKKQICP